MEDIRYKDLDEFDEKGGLLINKIPSRLVALENTYNNPNASVGDLWQTLRDYEELFQGLQYARKDGIGVDELLNQVQELGYHALLRVAGTLLNKLRESYDPDTHKVDETKGLNQDQF